MPSTTKRPASASPAKPGPAKKRPTPPKRGSTAGGRFAIAILGGLAVGVVAMTIYGLKDSGGDWAFNRPEAQLPSLQTKHTLQ
jgi:hypothetical protein